MSMDVDLVASREVEAPPAGEVGVLKALAEPLRAHIVALLADEELCVCHLVEALDVDQPLVSHHLRVLREAGVVTSERYRYWTYYRLVPEVIEGPARRLAAIGAAARAVDGRRRPCC